MAHSSLAQALDPTTAPARLKQLAYSRGELERKAARANPNLPTETLLACLEVASPDAWRNPALSFLLFSGQVPDKMVKGALLLARPFLVNPSLGRPPPDLKETLEMVLNLWWSTTTDTRTMFSLVWDMARAAGEEAQREVVRFVFLPHHEALHRRIVGRGPYTVAALQMLDRWAAGAFVSPDERSAQAAGVSAELSKIRAHLQTKGPPQRDTMAEFVRYAAGLVVGSLLRAFTATEGKNGSEAVVGSVGHFRSMERALDEGRLLSPNQMLAGSDDAVAELSTHVRQRWPSFGWSWDELERGRR